MSLIAACVCIASIIVAIALPVLLSLPIDMVVY